MKHNFHVFKLLGILLIVISLFYLSACKGLTGLKKGVQESEIHKGTEGLQMSFLQNAPPNDIIAPEEGQRTAFEVGVKVENKGAYDIKDSHILLVVEKDYMHITGWQMAEEDEFSQIGASGERISFTLEGRSQLDPVGKTFVAVSNMEALPLEKQSTTHTSTISLTACYDYETMASANVCIDTDVYNLKPIEKTCAVEDATLSGGQGAPVAVDKIEVSMLPGGEGFVTPQFVIHISNQGDGLVFRPDKVREACSASPLKPDEINIVKIDDITFSGYSLRAGHIECNPILLKLRGTEGRVVCRVNQGVISTEKETYETILQVGLTYGYSQTISKQVKISRS